MTLFEEGCIIKLAEGTIPKAILKEEKTMKDFLEKYWEDIVALIEKIYFAIKELILANEAE